MGQAEDAGMSRPRGRKNARPSREAIASYYQLLRDAADKGDVSAAAELIKIDHMTNSERRIRQESTHATR